MKKGPIDFKQCSRAALAAGAYFVDEDYAAFTGYRGVSRYVEWLVRNQNVRVQVWRHGAAWQVRIDPESLY